MTERHPWSTHGLYTRLTVSSIAAGFVGILVWGLLGPFAGVLMNVACVWIGAMIVVAQEPGHE